LFAIFFGDRYLNEETTENTSLRNHETVVFVYVLSPFVDDVRDNGWASSVV
jgi:hypothetical protein